MPVVMGARPWIMSTAAESKVPSSTLVWPGDDKLVVFPVGSEWLLACDGVTWRIYARTSDAAHPGARRIMMRPDWVVAGDLPVPAQLSGVRGIAYGSVSKGPQWYWVLLQVDDAFYVVYMSRILDI
jgi:hypothetical protein